MTPHDLAMQKAKIQLMSTPGAVFFMTVCFSLKHVWNPNIPTACTNGMTVEYSPEFFLSLSLKARVSLLLHETLHVAYMHMARLGGRCPERWNKATDYVINLMLHDRNFEIPQDWLLNTDFRGMSAEQVYDLLPNFGSPPPIFDLNPDSQSASDTDSDAKRNTDPNSLQKKIDGILSSSSRCFKGCTKF